MRLTTRWLGCALKVRGVVAAFAAEALRAILRCGLRGHGMKGKLLGLLTFMTLVSFSPASADTIYTYKGNDFTIAFGAFKTTDQVTGTIDLASALGDNLGLTQISPMSFSFSDGLQTITNTNSRPGGTLFYVETNSLGNIVQWDIAVASNFGNQIESCNATTFCTPAFDTPMPTVSDQSETFLILQASGQSRDLPSKLGCRAWPWRSVACSLGGGASKLPTADLVLAAAVEIEHLRRSWPTRLRTRLSEGAKQTKTSFGKSERPECRFWAAGCQHMPNWAAIADELEPSACPRVCM
jgi:hypothetical protein